MGCTCQCSGTRDTATSLLPAATLGTRSPACCSNTGVLRGRRAGGRKAVLVVLVAPMSEAVQKRAANNSRTNPQQCHAGSQTAASPSYDEGQLGIPHLWQARARNSSSCSSSRSMEVQKLVFICTCAPVMHANVIERVPGHDDRYSGCADKRDHKRPAR